MKVKDYYNTKAEQYDSERSKGFLKKCVSAEKNVIMHLLDIKKGESVLDVGCGSGFYSSLIKESGGNVFGIDISPKMVKEYRKKGFLGKVLDIVKSGVGKKFNKIICAGALEFTSNPNLALKNISSSLDKKSIFVLLYPRLTLGGLLYKMYHLRHGINIFLFSDRKIRRLLSKNGMKILKLEKPTFFAGVIKSELK